MLLKDSHRGCPLQACLDYMESLQELEGILGSDTCSQIRNDPRITNLLLTQQAGKLSSEKLTMERQHSASCSSATYTTSGVPYRRTA